jgi:hypothetical protein
MPTVKNWFTSVAEVVQGRRRNGNQLEAKNGSSRPHGWLPRDGVFRGAHRPLAPPLNSTVTTLTGERAKAVDGGRDMAWRGTGRDLEGERGWAVGNPPCPQRVGKGPGGGLRSAGEELERWERDQAIEWRGGRGTRFGQEGCLGVSPLAIFTPLDTAPSTPTRPCDGEESTPRLVADTRRRNQQKKRKKK